MGKERTIDGYGNRNITNPYYVRTKDTKENVLHLLLRGPSFEDRIQITEDEVFKQ